MQSSKPSWKRANAGLRRKLVAAEKRERAETQRANYLEVVNEAIREDFARAAEALVGKYPRTVGWILRWVKAVRLLRKLVGR